MSQETVKDKNKKKRKFLNKKVIGLILFLIIILVVVYEAKLFLTNNNDEGKGLSACQSLYNKKIDRFSKQTGLDHGNVVFNAPLVTRKRNLYIFTFKHINVGDQDDSFICYYNVTMKQAIDRTPEPKLN